MSKAGCLSDSTVVELASALLRCPSITPDQAGALDLVQEFLQPLGFHCRRLPARDKHGRITDNLYARLGDRQPNLCFCGHVDVVPPGELQSWRFAPFSGKIHDGILYGRGAVDMKGAIAAWLAAIARFLCADFSASLSIILTSDEEGPATHGVKHVVQWLQKTGEKIDHCLVGEPTNQDILGSAIKIGRRGSLNLTLAITGKQGHVAYPDQAQNPIPPLLACLGDLSATPLDQGSAWFQPSHLEITALGPAQNVTNVIPQTATAQANLRFNDCWDGLKLASYLEDIVKKTCKKHHVDYDFKTRISAESFVSEPDHFCRILADAIAKITQKTPVLSTLGGTSDARFMKDICPVAEFGLVGQTMHQINEQTTLHDLDQLNAIYHELLCRYFRT